MMGGCVYISACKLDWYMQYFINAVCTFLSNCVTFVK